MTMRAELQISDRKGDLLRGDYIFLWTSPSQWREEIRFANYVRLRVGDANGYWQTSGLNYQPEKVFQLDTLLHLKEATRVATKEGLGKVRNRKSGGMLESCTDVKWRGTTERTLCFDDADGTLADIEYRRVDQEPPLDITRIEYGAFETVAGKLVPYQIRALNGQKVVAAVTVTEITPITQQDSALFKAPLNAEFWAQCDDMQQPEAANQVLPKYPAEAKANYEQGRVIVYAVVETDGSLSHLAIIQGAAPDLEAAALEAVRQWHYKPPTCIHKPIRMETSVNVDFVLGQ